MIKNENSTFYFYPTLPPMITNTTSGMSLRWNVTGSTVAGDASGNKGVAADQFNLSYSLALDSNNSLYISDYYNNRIQKWMTGASIGVTVAGNQNATSGSTLTSLHLPVGIIVLSNGSMYISDRANQRVMYFEHGNSSGRSIAGTGAEAWLYFSGMAGNASNQLNGPSALVLISNSSTLYIADTYNHRIIAYLLNETSGTIVAGGHGAGNNNNQLYNPFCFAWDSLSSSFLIVNYGGHSIVRWVLGASTWTLVAGTTGILGSTSTTFNFPLSIVLDPMGNMYIADVGNHRIQLLLAGQSNGITIAGVSGINGTTPTLLNKPYWAILDDQLNLYVADSYNNRVQKFMRY